MCSTWEKREEHRPERMKLRTNIGQLQRRVPMVCETEKWFVASDWILERWKRSSFVKKTQVTWKSVLSKNAVAVSMGGGPALPRELFVTQPPP